VRSEDGVVTIVERQLDFEGAIVLRFGRAIARDLVAFVETAPTEKAIVRPYSISAVASTPPKANSAQPSLPSQK